MMNSRSIQSRARHGSTQLLDVLRSLLALELLHTSETIYLISPWISDIVIIDDVAGRYRSIMPEKGRQTLRLSVVLGLLSDRGSTVRVISRSDQASNDDFLRRMPKTVGVRFDNYLHQKMLVSSKFYLRGSMNFTYSGVRINDESVEISSSLPDIAQALLEADALWQSLRK